MRSAWPFIGISNYRNFKDRHQKNVAEMVHGQKAISGKSETGSSIKAGIA